MLSLLILQTHCPPGLMLLELEVALARDQLCGSGSEKLAQNVHMPCLEKHRKAWSSSSNVLWTEWEDGVGSEAAVSSPM